ncbi:glycine N-methyltransferase-like [Phymastichus coffea]|uniref:glycine N-methyltransferase-like n=1 Tax=Phymastichus coffea TaxID=108790 RepID=UPI00273B4860|nr:glycine N-methyltransferase-like [Phymastichus coffea]XP_058788648.1 glycine N-methyltransferase-like [Phymastichus coffea]XP_058788649.1 glycine N-methyltransferase-like [Phymastichus coffea]XP_058788650.1 glycine N-methyltransferase-like [Phymastichus coffea]XP_058788651.1 glycine N-methyltransferase-like [Phymastichus coffea]XP_058788652.1 glycine N-methyltransferase-like [Phymastichus coffea]
MSTINTDSAFPLRSLGAAAEGVRDQYADGKAAKVWQAYIVDNKQRKQNYKDFLVGLLRDHGCQRILDVACGTGVDSMMLLEEGFQVVSVDASDKMLKYALKSRWERRKEKAFDDWVIEEANWLTLEKDIRPLINDGFDAVLCLGNSFPHILDGYGDQREQKQALYNFERCVKPGGLLLIDHRNYEHILKGKSPPIESMYYNNNYLKKIETSVIYKNGIPCLVTLDYLVEINSGDLKESEEQQYSEFRLSYYPHMLDAFTKLVDEAFPKRRKHEIYGDFKPLTQIPEPGFYIHVVQK